MQRCFRAEACKRLVLEVSLLIILVGNCFSADRAFYTREEIADLIFPSLAIEHGGTPYDTRVILRFSNPDSEIVVLKGSNLPGNVKVYKLSDGASIKSIMGNVLLRNPQATPEDIALSAKVEESDLSVPVGVVARWLKTLKTKCTAPVVEPWIQEGRVPEYDFWIDSNGDSIHYHFFFVANQVPSSQAAFEPVAQWMVKIRSEINSFESQQRSRRKK
jgi:hypothetical protein